MSRSSFSDLLEPHFSEGKFVCVGLDSEFSNLPAHIKGEKNPQFVFNKAIIDATHDLVCVYKPNSAFYEARGIEGIKDLKMTCDYVKETYPKIPVIIDAKRGDIGNTNTGYAKFVFEYLGADAITVMPYMGIESLEVFYSYKNKGIILGCHSSNPGGKEFQELLVDGKPVYHIVAEKLIRAHGDNPNTMIFMGATYPEELVGIRKIVGDMTLLVPGVGVQGGDVKMFVSAGINSKKSGLIINSSRGVILASSSSDFARKAREATQKLHQEILFSL